MSDELPASITHPRYLADGVAMEPVMAALERAAGTDVRVVLYGETGVGKSFAGATLHHLGTRRNRALTRLSLRSPGAGVQLTSPELQPSVEGGTLLLEGVDDAPDDVQSALVGVLEEWAGIEDDGEAPVRVIATSERELGSVVASGTFRTDLYYLLEVFPVCIPPLRQRAEEVPQLVAEFARRRGRDPAKLPDLPAAFLEQAMTYSWPGNLRELASVVDRALPAPGSDEWQFPALLSGAAGGASVPPFHIAKRAFELSYVHRLLLVTGGNVTRAAELAGKARKDFYALMARNQVDPASFRSGAGG